MSKSKRVSYKKKTKIFNGWFNSQQCSDDFLKVSWSYLQSVVRYEQECIAADHPIPNTGVHGNACIFWPRFFLDLKFSGIVPNNIFYHFWRFEQNRSRSFWEMVEKPSKNAHIRNYWRIQNFFGWSGSVIFLSLSISNFWPKISKIRPLEVSKIWSLTN